MNKAWEDISREEFEDYEDVRKSGAANMLSPQARELTGLDYATFMCIIEHYEELMEKWPKVRG